jgi:hypothetical protein
LIFAQVALGGATWLVKYGWPAWFADSPWASWYTVQERSLTQALIVTGHVAVGSLVVVTSVLAAMWSLRFVCAAGERSAGDAVPALVGAIAPAALFAEGV